jgi:3-hydroxy acid dehydrogenase / malonic semialdehyde reductase
LSSNWAFITGASAGFGRAIAEKLASENYNLVVCARRMERLTELKNHCESKFKVEVVPLAFDISNREACMSALEKNSSVISKTTVLVNNAGLAKGVEPFQEGKISDWEVMIDTNVKGLLYVTRAILPHMIARKSGHVVNLGSVAGRWTYPGGAVYAATKFAVRALNDSIRMDIMGTGVRVTNIEPGMAKTEFSEVRLGDSEKANAIYRGMTPLSAEDIAETVSWCVGRPAHVNIQELVIFPTDQAGVGPSYTHRR